jgi:hypothetical protein
LMRMRILLERAEIIILKIPDQPSVSAKPTLVKSLRGKTASTSNHRTTTTDHVNR